MNKEDKLEYYYDEQLKKLLVQFLAVFTCLKVKSGKTGDLEERFIDVQVKTGSSDRVVAAVKAMNTQTSPIRLPLIAGQIANIDIDTSLMKGTKVKRQFVKFPAGGQFPNDLTTVEQVMPIPYRVQFELNMFASSQEQHFEMLEQILILFDPTLDLFTSDELLDWTRLKTLKLENISVDDGIPGTERRFIQTTLNFSAPIYLSVPSIVKQNYIGEIKMRVGAVENLYPTEDALAQLDSDSIEYETIASLKDLTLPS